MADSEATSPVPPPVEENKLKYLDFLQVAAIYVAVCYSTIYEYAKDNSGPLRPAVRTVEGAVRTAIGPVYRKFHTLPFQLLQLVDRKLDEWIIEADYHAPRILKEISRRALAAAQMAPGVARNLVSEVQRTGLAETASRVAKTAYTRYEPTAKELYNEYEPMAEQYAVAAWRSLNQLPLFSQVAHIMVPTAAYWAEKYNKAVDYAAEKGYTVSHYLPLVPIARIAKIFQGGAEMEPAESATMHLD